MTTLLSPPAVSGLGDARAAVLAAARVALWSLTDNQLAAEVADAVALRAQADAVLLARLGEADARGLALTRGASSMTGWLRCSHRLAAGEASRLVKTARSLREQLPATAQALGDGEVNLGEVEVIVEALTDLTDQVNSDMRAEGETTLIKACAELDPVALGRLGRRLEELLDPEGVQARDEAKIRDHEKRAFGKRGLSFTPDPYGSGGTIRGRYDAAGYAVIAAALEPLCTPWSDVPAGDAGADPGIGPWTVLVAGKDLRGPAARRYDAFVEVCLRGLHHPATASEGGKAQIRVTIPLASLRDRGGCGVLDDGTEISPTLARVLACDAGIIPAVLNSHGQPIDVGREQRLFKGGARIAVEIRDGGCTWPGCSRPASWCQIHHLIPWQAGGRTDQVNGGLFCWIHHREIEKSEWEAFHHRGRIWLRPPTRLDPQRAPRINTTHRPPPPRHDWPPALGQGPP